MTRTLLLAAGLLLLTLPARAGESFDPGRAKLIGDPEDPVEETVLPQAAEGLGIEVAPAVEPEGSGSRLRPLDDTDPEMRELVLRFLRAVPCRDETSGYLCRRARDILRGGGDRVAHYLIHQVDENEAEGWSNQGTYVRLVGYTESPVAYEYLRRRVLDKAAIVEAKSAADPEAAHDQFLWAIEALGETRALAVPVDAVALLDRFEGDTAVRLRAVNAIGKVQERHGRVEAVRPKLEAIAAPSGEGAASGETEVAEEADEGTPASLARRAREVLDAP